MIITVSVGIRKVGIGWIVSEQTEEEIKPKVDTELSNIKYNNVEEIFTEKSEMQAYVKKVANKL